MRAAIDTNIFLYATFPQFSQHPKCRQFLKETRSQSNEWYVGWGTIYEYLRVATHPRLWQEERLSLADAIRNVTEYLNDPNVSLLEETPSHLENLTQLGNTPDIQGNIMHDAHLVVLMREHDITTVCSADTDFHRFKGIRVINPLQ